MIEKMLKTTIICRSEDQEDALLNLRSLGLLHVEQINKPENQTLTTVEQGMDKLSKIVNILSEYVTKEADPFSKKSPRALAKMALKNVDQLSEAEKEIASLKKEKILLEPWGEFSFEQLDKLSDKGVFVYLCMGNKKILHECCDKYTIEIINQVKDKTYFAIIAHEKLDESCLPIVDLPQSKISLTEIDKSIAEKEEMIAESHAELASIAQSIEEIKLFQKEVQQQYEFLNNKFGMGEAEKLVYIKGYIPEAKSNRISAAADRCGWGVVFEEPTPEDKVPTHLKVPKIFSIIMPVFDFIGISPGYNEWDVSACFLFFFAIFFAMIVGDAGYGILFLAAGIALKIILRNKRNARLPLNLFIFLSIATIIWGALTGTYFGLSKEHLPHDLSGLKILTSEDTKMEAVLLICFTLGVVHLSLARVWKAIIYRRTFRDALGQIGWALFLWGNFFTALKLIVFSDMTYPKAAFALYIIGFILILTCYVNWKDAGSLFNAPFEFISSFVDLLSYIRLYAVGLASLYIASCFNNMGAMVYHISPWATVFAVLVIVAGHLLNIALAFMGVLVHGIRLNTLEFSNHMELEWSGSFYKPFKRLVRDRGDAKIAIKNLTSNKN